MIIKIFIFIAIVIFVCIFFFKRKEIFSKIRKRKNWLFGKYRWLKRKTLKKYGYFKMRFYIPLFFIKEFLLFLSIFIFLYILFIIFLKSLNAIRIENNQLTFYFELIELNKYHYDFLWSQISSTLIVSTIIGFLGIFSTNYVYGKKQINVIFNSKGLFTLSKMFIYLIVLIFITLINCINTTNSFIILSSFIFSLLLIFYMLFKVLIFYVFPKYYEKSLKCEYLIREAKHIKKAMPLMPYKDVEIENFKYHTMELIQRNDNEYNKNIIVLMDLLNISLLNNKKNIQEYYTELIERTDFITSILEIIKHLIIYDKILEADNIMYELFYKLSYYRIVPVQDHISNDIIHSLILKGKNIKDEYTAQKHFYVLWQIVNQYKYLLYLYYCEIDFSYCRLGKVGKDGKNEIYYFTHNNYLQDIYQSIFENNHLTPKEKERIFNDLYTNIRMMEHKEKFPDCDVRQIKEYMAINKNAISIPLIIKGEPIVLMFLKMFENNDIENLKLFKTMNISNELRAYITTLASLSLLEFIKNDCIREYVNDLITTKENIINNYKICYFQSYLDDSEELYKILNNNYVESHKKNSQYYSFTSRLTLSDETINTFYYYKYIIKGKNKKEFEKITKMKKFTPNNKIIEIIKELGI